MSIDLDWPGLTTGPDGARFAESMRSFLDEKFQQITLPRFVRSVQVQSFKFGSIPPDLEVIDICDPFPDFYEDDEDDEDDDGGDEGRDGEEDKERAENDKGEESSRRRKNSQTSSSRNEGQEVRKPNGTSTGSRDTPRTSVHRGEGEDLEVSIGSSNRNQFKNTRPSLGTDSRAVDRDIDDSTMTSGLKQSPLNRGFQRDPPTGGLAHAGLTEFPFQSVFAKMQGPNRHFRPFNHPLSGTATPFAMATGFSSNSQPSSYFLPQIPGTSSSTQFFPELANPSSPTSPSPRQANADLDGWSLEDTQSNSGYDPLDRSRMAPENENDFQIMCRVRYSGDIQMTVTAELLLDFPLAGSVGIPVKLNITGVTFDGVAVIARVRDGKKIHFCFLPPQDYPPSPPGSQEDLPRPSNRPPFGESESSSFVRTASGTEFRLGGGGFAGHHDPSSPSVGSGGILSSIHVESEIGANAKEGKQALKNVGKVERFVLKQVRRVFETELVFPSFWTFLV